MLSDIFAVLTNRDTKIGHFAQRAIEISFLMSKIHEKAIETIFLCRVINILKTLYCHFHKT